MKQTFDNSKNELLELAYTDKLGNKWYNHSNVLGISPARGIAAARADRYVGLKISENNFKDLINAAIDGVNTNQDFVGAFAILNELKYRSEFLCEENSILDLASIYYFLEDENPEFPSEYHNKKKLDIWQKDELCRGFFLHMGLALTKRFSTTAEDDLLKFLQESLPIAERIYRFIPRQ